MLSEQGDDCRGTDNTQHEDQALTAADFDVPAKATDDGGDAHEAAIGVEGRNGHLAKGNAEIQQRCCCASATQADDVGDFTAGELTVGDCCGKHAENHRGLRAHYRAKACGEEGLD